MILRAEDSVYWPGFVSDIEAIRAQCPTCHAIAPSQPSLPPVDPITPQYPFQHICMDYFHLNGQNYGVFVDRYTGWPGVYLGNAAMDVCTVIARLSEDYGIPETCSVHLPESPEHDEGLWSSSQTELRCKPTLQLSR